MIEVPTYDGSGAEKGTVEVDEDLFGGFVRKRLLFDAVLVYEANRRVGSAKTKSKAEKAGSGRKLWRQKGTGRARVGQRRSPHRVGGGPAFGPRGDRRVGRDMNRKARRRALDSALLGKLQAGTVKIAEGLGAELGTRKVSRALDKMGWPEGDSLLLVTAGAETDENLKRSARNLRKTMVLRVADLNAWDVARHRRVLFTPDAFDALLEARRTGVHPQAAARGGE